MDKVTAAMVLTSLSTSPLVRSPPVKVGGEYRTTHFPMSRPPHKGSDHIPLPHPKQTCRTPASISLFYG